MKKRGRLVMQKRLEQGGPSTLEVAVLLETALQQSFDSLVRFSPCQRCLEGIESVEELVGGRQRDLIDESFGRCDGAPIEGGDPSRERIDEAVQFRVRERTIDVSVSLGGVAV